MPGSTISSARVSRDNSFNRKYQIGEGQEDEEKRMWLPYSNDEEDGLSQQPMFNMDPVDDPERLGNDSDREGNFEWPSNNRFNKQSHLSISNSLSRPESTSISRENSSSSSFNSDFDPQQEESERQRRWEFGHDFDEDGDQNSPNDSDQGENVEDDRDGSVSNSFTQLRQPPEVIVHPTSPFTFSSSSIDYQPPHDPVDEQPEYLQTSSGSKLGVVDVEVSNVENDKQNYNGIDTFSGAPIRKVGSLLGEIVVEEDEGDNEVQTTGKVTAGPEK
ncbi:hypothetical protein BKA69DRAFT_49697 [Paraphysoderma sedebokerense]|nr:hypothetical protein BKA69DRAFT_49697 [Paraphysoderma sedebokerense]